MLVWEGMVKKSHFDKWKVIEVATESEGRRLFAEKGLEGYWIVASKLEPASADLDDLNMLLK